MQRKATMAMMMTRMKMTRMALLLKRKEENTCVDRLQRASRSEFHRTKRWPWTMRPCRHRNNRRRVLKTEWSADLRCCSSRSAVFENRSEIVARLDKRTVAYHNEVVDNPDSVCFGVALVQRAISLADDWKVRFLPVCLLSITLLTMGPT